MFTKNSGTTKLRVIAFLYAAVLVFAATSANAQTWPEPGNKHSGPGAGLLPYGGGEFSPLRSKPLGMAPRGEYSEMDKLGSMMKDIPDAKLGGNPYRPPTQTTEAVAIRRGGFWLSPK